MTDDDFDDDDDLLACQHCDEEFPEAELKLVDGWELCPKCIADGVNAETIDDHIEELSDFVDRVSKDHPLDDF